MGKKCEQTLHKEDIQRANEELKSVIRETQTEPTGRSPAFLPERPGGSERIQALGSEPPDLSGDNAGWDDHWAASTRGEHAHIPRPAAQTAYKHS